MIKDHVDLLVALAEEEYELDGLEMLDMFCNMYFVPLPTHVWCEFFTKGVKIGYKDEVETLYFPFPEDLLFYTIETVRVNYDKTAHNT